MNPGDLSAIETIVAKYIEDELAYDHAGSVDPHEPLLEGLIASPDIMRLVVFLEERFDIHVADRDVRPEHFANVHRIARLVVGQSSTGVAERP